MSGATRLQRIESALRAAFPDAQIELRDDSHLHAGHAGAASGGGHFHVHIRSAAFAGLGLLARHRAVYAALGALMEQDIHALGITAQAPDEAPR
jgi:BolA family transcriptional regulator, general stress-responsive regulator